MSSTTPAPDPPLPLSLRLAGAVVILLGAAFVLAVATAGAFAALHLTLPRATSSTTQTLPVGAAPALVLRGATGDVRVLAGGDGEVRVDVTRKGRALTAQRAAEYMARHAVDDDANGRHGDRRLPRRRGHRGGPRPHGRVERRRHHGVGPAGDGS